MSGGTQLVGEGDDARVRPSEWWSKRTSATGRLPFAYARSPAQALVRPRAQPYRRLAPSARCRDDRFATLLPGSPGVRSAFGTETPTAEDRAPAARDYKPPLVDVGCDTSPVSVRS